MHFRRFGLAEVVALRGVMALRGVKPGFWFLLGVK